MHGFGLLVLASAAFFGTSSALVDAGVRTTVTVDANAYDERTSGYGCSPSGCIPENTRDGINVDNSRWSCKEDLSNENCEICYDFDEPQDIVYLWFALYNGDQGYTRKFKVKLNGNTWGTIESSGTTNGYQSFWLDTDETGSLCLESVEQAGSDWVSIKEVQFRVL